MADIHGLFEILDRILLLCKSQTITHDGLSDHSIWISLAQQHPLEEQSNVALNFKVRVGGLGPYSTVNGRSFLQTIVDTFKGMMANDRWCCPDSAVVFHSKRVGDDANVCTYKTLMSTSPLLVSESVSTRPLDFTGFTLEITKILFNSELIKANLFPLLHQYLRLSQLINPQITLHLNCSLLGALPQSVVLYPLPWMNIASTSFKLASSVESYTAESRPIRNKKIKLSHCTSPTVIRNCSICDDISASIRLSCYAGIIPHLKMAKGKKICADQVCSELKVSFYGPGNIQLFLFGLKPTMFNIHELAKWSDYRIKVGRSIEPNDDSSSLQFALSPQRLLDQQRSLHVFFFIEEEDTLNTYEIAEQKWIRYNQLTSAIRNNLNQFLSSINHTLQRLLNSTLNKLIFNYTDYTKINTAISSSVPIVSDAVSSIIKNSNSLSFQGTCLSVLKTDSLDETQIIIEECLRSLTEKKLGIMAPANVTINTDDLNAHQENVPSDLDNQAITISDEDNRNTPTLSQTVLHQQQITSTTPNQPPPLNTRLTCPGIVRHDQPPSQPPALTTTLICPSIVCHDQPPSQPPALTTTLTCPSIVRHDQPPTQPPALTNTLSCPNIVRYHQPPTHSSYLAGVRSLNNTNSTVQVVPCDSEHDTTQQQDHDDFDSLMEFEPSSFYAAENTESSNTTTICSSSVMGRDDVCCGMDYNETDFITQCDSNHSMAAMNQLGQTNMEHNDQPLPDGNWQANNKVRGNSVSSNNQFPSSPPTVTNPVTHDPITTSCVPVVPLKVTTVNNEAFDELGDIELDDDSLCGHNEQFMMSSQQTTPTNHGDDGNADVLIHSTEKEDFQYCTDDFLWN